MALDPGEVVELPGLRAREHGGDLGVGEEEGGAVRRLVVSDGYAVFVGSELDAVSVPSGGG